MPVIPNSIGRMDPIIDAIRMNQYGKVEELLEAEIKRCQHMVHVTGDEYRKQTARLAEVVDFAEKFGISQTFRNECEAEVDGR